MERDGVASPPSAPLFLFCCSLCILFSPSFKTQDFFYSRHPRTGRYQAPSASTLRRVFSGIDAEQFDTVVAQWVSGREDIHAVALDGKALRGCLNPQGQPLFLVNTVAHGSGAFQGQVQVDCKSNEIPAARQLLAQMGPLDGVMVTTDARPTRKSPPARPSSMMMTATISRRSKATNPACWKKLNRFFPLRLFPPFGLACA